MFDLATLAASGLDVAVIIVLIVALAGTVGILVRAIIRSRAPHNLVRYQQGWVDARKRWPPLAHDRHYLKGYKAAYSAEIEEQNRRMQ